MVVGGEEVRGADVAVVDVEVLVDGEDGKHHLIDKPHCIGNGLRFYYSLRNGRAYRRC